MRALHKNNHMMMKSTSDVEQVLILFQNKGEKGHFYCRAPLRSNLFIYLFVFFILSLTLFIVILFFALVKQCLALRHKMNERPRHACNRVMTSPQLTPWLGWMHSFRGQNVAKIINTFHTWIFVFDVKVFS